MHVCEICNKEFSSKFSLSVHLSHMFKKHIEGHDISVKQYYDKYIKRENDGICITCGKDTKFRSINQGYAKFCSNMKCVKPSEENKIKRINTSLLKYGVKNPVQSEIIKSKIKNTNISKYGTDWGLSNKDIVNKRLNTNKEKFLDSLFDNTRLNNICKPNFNREDYNKCNSKKYSWICSLCGSIFNDYIINGSIPRCKICFPVLSNTSQYENEIYQYCKSLCLEVIKNDRTILEGKELDIYIPSENIAIEFNGLYWYSELHKDKNYHLNKTLKCKDKNIKLIHIFEDEWLLKKDIVKSIISSKLNKIQNKIYARKCLIKEVDNKKACLFLDNNHIQGKILGIHIGLYYDNELVSIMTFGKSRFNKKYQYELLRFCSKINTIVVGAMSKMFNYFLNKYNPESLISYSDRRYGEGDSYIILGMYKIKPSPPGYTYNKHREVERVSRLQFQKHKIKDKLKIFDSTLSESVNMQLNDYHRVWDCGNNVYVWTSNQKD